MRYSFEYWTKKVSTPQRSVSFDFVEVSFNVVDDADQRQALNNIGTNFDLEATVVLQLKSAKFALKERKQRAQDAMIKISELLEAKQEETVEAVATWKVKRHQQRLEARADRAEAYAENCVAMALYYAAESDLALLEAISARQDAKGR